MKVRDLVVALVAVTATVSIARAQSDPIVGTWKLNLAKSKYSVGAPKSATLVVTAAGKGFKVSANAVLADGASRKIEYTSMYDGMDAAVTGSPDYDTVAIKKTAEGSSGERKKAGKVVQTFTRNVSADGKTMTTTTKGTNAAGQKVDNVQVYDKQ
jgi:hypothetical protein